MTESPKFKRGTALPHSKLNDELVRVIRRQHARKEKLKKKLDELYSAEAFAERYGVAKTTIDKVLTYETWRHVLEVQPGRKRVGGHESKRTHYKTAGR